VQPRYFMDEATRLTLPGSLGIASKYLKNERSVPTTHVAPG